MAIHISTLHVAADHPAFDGHFPGQPLLPGVVLLAEVMEAALAVPELASQLGSAPRIAAAKFLAPVLPGDLLTITLTNDATRLRFEVSRGNTVAASGQFQ